MQPYLNRFAGVKRLAEPDPEDTELSAKRRKNDLRHESEWNAILRRYSKDFSAVTDDIDLSTGQVVVDNGHLKSMQHELDDGLESTETPHRSTRLVSEMLTDGDHAAARAFGAYDVHENEDEDDEDDEDEDGEDVDEDEDEGDESEDELSSNWPKHWSPSSSKQTPALKEVGRRSRTSTAETENLSRQSNSQSPQSPYRNTPLQSIEAPSARAPTVETAPQAVPPIPFPHIELPHLDLPDDMQSKMQALVPVFQAQMMAFMNIVMAPTPTESNTLTSISPQALAFPTLNRPVPPFESPGPIRNTPNIASQNQRQEDMRRAIAGHYNIPSDPIEPTSSSSRGVTPGRGSLWARPGDRPQGRKALPNASASTATTPASKAPGRKALPPASRLRKSTATTLNGTEGTKVATLSTSGHPMHRSSSSLRAAGRTNLPADLTNVACPPPPELSPPKRRRGRPPKNARTSLTDASRTTISSLLADDERRSSTTPPIQTPSPCDSPDIQFIADSEDEVIDSERDEIDVITPPQKSAKKTPTTSRGPKEAPGSLRHLQMTETAPKSSKKGATSRALDSGRSQDKIPTSKRTARSLLIASTSKPRFNLRDRNQVISYDEKAAFSALLDDPPPDNDSESDIDMNDNASDNEQVSEVEEINRRSPARPILQSTAIALSASPFPSDSLQEAQIAKNIAAVTPPTFHHSNHGVEQTYPEAAQNPYYTVSASVTVSSQYTAYQQEYLIKYGTDPFASLVPPPASKTKPLVYDDRPQPHPCLHCKCTFATTWIPDPAGSVRRICNACWSYMKKYDGKKRPASYQDFRESTIPQQSPCDHCGNISIRERMPDKEGRRLCRVCKSYAKDHEGQLPPQSKIRKTKQGHVNCERCPGNDTFTVLLSNHARVCKACHDEIFQNYDLNFEEAAIEEAEDYEMFFDHCLLIYAHQILPQLPGVEDDYGKPNAQNKPCKACHKQLACRWRRALNGTQVCETCYRHVGTLIEKHDLYARLGKDGMGYLKDVKTKDFLCATCEEPIRRTKWRKESERGNVVCSECFERSHQPAGAK